MNGTILIQRGGGLFTERRWRKQSTAEILALITHIKRHPSVESYGEAPRSVEQEDPNYVGHVCFIDRLPGLSTVPDRPGITTMQEESAGSMIAPLSDGNADGISGPSKGTEVKDGPHVGETTGKGGSKEGVGEHVCFIDTLSSAPWGVHLRAGRAGAGALHRRILRPNHGLQGGASSADEALARPACPRAKKSITPPGRPPLGPSQVAKLISVPGLVGWSTIYAPPQWGDWI